jgi:hypothetical protein
MFAKLIALPKICRAKTVAIFFVMLGVFLTSLGVTLLDFAQGHIFGNWSGIAPVGRLNDLPIRIACATGVSLFVNLTARFFRYPPMVQCSKQTIFGALCGLATVGSLFDPWVSGRVDFSLICFLLVIGLAFWYRAHVVQFPIVSTTSEKPKNEHR